MSGLQLYACKRYYVHVNYAKTTKSILVICVLIIIRKYKFYIAMLFTTIYKYLTTFQLKQAKIKLGLI